MGREQEYSSAGYKAGKAGAFLSCLFSFKKLPLIGRRSAGLVFTSKRLIRIVRRCEGSSMIVAIGTWLIDTLVHVVAHGAIALLHYLVMGTSRIIVSAVHVAIFAEICPFTLASGNGSRSVVNTLPYEKAIRRAVWFMTICARQDVVAALVVIVRRPEIGIATVITGSSPAMLFRIPVKLVKVSSKPSTPDII
jgi:hypothetical protein